MESIDVAQPVVRAVAGYENVEPDDLPPLEESVPIDVFHKLKDVQNRSEPLHFTYLWYQITVQPSGAVAVEP